MAHSPARRNSKSTKSDPWAKAFALAIVDNNRLPPGDGWETCEELAKRYNINRRTMSERLLRLRDRGAVELFDGLQCGHGMRWYRLL